MNSSILEVCDGITLHITPHSKPDSRVLICVTSKSESNTYVASRFNIEKVNSAEYLLEPALHNKVSNSSTFAKKVIAVAQGFMWTSVCAFIAFSALNVTGLVKSQVVLTGSMSPAINPGDLVISTSPEQIEPKIGDVVVYTGKRFDGTRVASFAHRIIAGDAKAGFVVKGDNNPDADTQKPVLADIEGVVLFTVPFVGKLLNPQIFILLMLAAFGLWLIFDAFRNED